LRLCGKKYILADMQASSSKGLSAEARLKRLREHLNFSQRDLAKEFKVAPGAIAFWESGARSISGPALKLLELYEDEFDLFTETETEADEFYKLPVGRSARVLNVSIGLSKAAIEVLKLMFLKAIVSEPNISKLKKRAYRKMALGLVERLVRAKGLGIKVFHILGFLDFTLPSEMQEVVRSYQTMVVPMPQKKLAEVFHQEFGKPPKLLFSAWTAKPLAAASIGQVHLAKLATGESVAVKVQYPKIADAVRADLQNIELVQKWTSFLFPQQDRAQIILELKERFLEECDYKIERRNQDHFGKIYQDREEILIPKTYPEHSTSRVLVTEFMHGQSFDEFCKTATRDERDRAGQTMWKFAVESILKHGLFNADPHPGNYLFQGGKVVFLDFGCVKRGLFSHLSINQITPKKSKPGKAR